MYVMDDNGVSFSFCLLVQIGLSNLTIGSYLSNRSQSGTLVDRFLLTKTPITIYDGE